MVRFSWTQDEFIVNYIRNATMFYSALLKSCSFSLFALTSVPGERLR